MQNIINIVLILGLIYVIFRLPSLEQMSNVDKATEDKIREIYKIDTDAIRNLSNLAKDLTVNGKLKVPGGLDIIDKLKLGPSAWDRHLILGGKNREAVNGVEAHIHSTNGNLHLDSQNNHQIYLNHYTKKPVIIGNEITLNTPPKTPDGKIKINNDGIMFGGNNNSTKEVNSAQISAGLHVPNSLNIVGMSDDNKANRKIDMWAEGGLNVNGKTYINGLLKVNRTDAHPWNNGWGNGVHTWDLKVDSSADINNLIVKNKICFNNGVCLAPGQVGNVKGLIVENGSLIVPTCNSLVFQNHNKDGYTRFFGGCEAGQHGHGYYFSAHDYANNGQWRHGPRLRW